MIAANASADASPDARADASASAASGSAAGDEVRCVVIDPVPIDSFPPLEAPDDQMSAGAAAVGMVLGIIASFSAITHAIAFGPLGTLPAGAWWASVVLINLESLVALVALIGLMTSDPGVIRRSPQTCYPMPADVAERLREGKPLPERNVTDGERSYCVRCLVWRSSRPPTSESCSPGSPLLHPHHCSTCRRCVGDFDHHCGVFGMCSAAATDRSRDHPSAPHCAAEGKVPRSIRAARSRRPRAGRHGMA
jgi:hypothetical protein